jgi:diguanylate cyclase (GGDEF)-like protein
MGTLLVAAVLIRQMQVRVEGLIAKLYDAGRTDPLTDLSNRRGFRELLDLELERARRGGGEMTVVVADVDRFKELNDRCGQLVGDATLRRVAGVLEAGRRRLDVVARVGGAEFALILPDTSQHEAFATAERLREQVRAEFARESVPVRLSIGVATYPRHAGTA